MAIDFPAVVTDPSQPWTNPDTGITYIYKDGAWRVISQSNIVDINDEFVNVSGDNMTGALTIGPAGSPVTTLAANGTATFTNTVIADGPDSAAAALLVRSNYTAGTGNQVFLVRGNTDNDIAWINGDGNATFAGTVVSGFPPDFSSATINGTSLSMGQIFTQVPSGFPGGTEVYGQYFGTASAVSFKANGNAEFAGNVSTPNLVSTTSNNGIAIYPEALLPVDALGVGQNNTKDLGSVGIRFRNVYAITARMGNFVVELDQDNDANYITTTEEYTETETYTGPLGNTLEREVTKTRDIRTYTGPTIDVKDRLTKADTALQTLKTAAAAAVDFAELKAAIATALADI